MCGIIAYLGQSEAQGILINGLKRLEYRGYDSAGIVTINPDGLSLTKAVGKVQKLQDKLSPSSDTVGIAHTRWATHGKASEENAHPHLDQTGKIAVVHNGIIDNFQELKDQLIKKGYTFQSETDSEVIAQLISEFYDGKLSDAVSATLKILRGTYGLLVVSTNEPDTVIAARKGSPIIIGCHSGHTIIASDTSAIVSHASEVIYLDDNDIAEVTAQSINIKDMNDLTVSRGKSTIDWKEESIDKAGYKHFMLKEIHEQPQALMNSMRGRLKHDDGTAILSGLRLEPQEISNVDRILIFACGTSLHAAMTGQYFIEELTGIPVTVCQAADFRYRNPIVEKGTLAIALSQSGETADTLAAVREAKRKGAEVISLCNVIGSTIARETKRGVYLHAGPEISVASTKAYTCQVLVLLQIALKIGRSKRLSLYDGQNLCYEISDLPKLVEKTLLQEARIKDIAQEIVHCKSMFYIGRDNLFPAALEGALKMKEVSYIHAEGYHAAELKHGPIALLDENTPVIALACEEQEHSKMLGNISECAARKAPLVVLQYEDSKDASAYTDMIIQIPRSSKFLANITTSIALQLLAYYVADLKGEDIDQPRNLAKSVTVE